MFISTWVRNWYERAAVNHAVHDPSETGALLGTPIGQALVGIEQYRSVLGRFIESAGFADSAEFFREVSPEQLQQMQQQNAPQTDPQAQALMAQVQAQIQSEQARAQSEIAIQQQKAQADIALQREKAAASIQLEREKAEANLQLKIAEFQAESPDEGG
jgi:hypothetical protein